MTAMDLTRPGRGATDPRLSLLGAIGIFLADAQGRSDPVQEHAKAFTLGLRRRLNDGRAIGNRRCTLNLSTQARRQRRRAAGLRAAGQQGQAHEQGNRSDRHGQAFR